jgi:hypothetical protein
MAPPKPQGAPQGQAPNPAQDAARISGMEQEAPMSAEEVARKSLMDRKVQSEALEQQIQLLSKSLDSRMNPGYDVPLMQMAAGFLKPTKTGSFGESLGYGMENYSKAAEEEFARKQLVDKQRLEYMQKMADIQKQRGLLDYQLADMGAPAQTTLRTGAEPLPPGAPAGTPPVGGGMPSAPSVGAPPSAASNPTALQNSRRPMTIDRAKLESALDDKMGEQAWKQLEAERKQAELQLAQIKSSRERFVPTQFGMWDTDKQDWVQKNPYLQKAEKFDFGAAGEKSTTGDVYAKYKEIQAIQDPKLRDEKLLEFYVSQGWLAGGPSKPAGGATVSGTPAGGTAPSGGAKPPGLAPSGGGGASNPFGLPTRFKSEEEKKEEALQDSVRKAALEALESQRAKDSETRATAAFNAGKTAPTIRGIGKDMEGWATNNPRIFDLLQRPEVGDRFKKFVEAGVDAGRLGTFSLPVSILEQNKNNKITTEDLQALQMFAQASAKLTTEMRKISRSPGEGATDAKEGELYARVEALPSDSSQVIRLKSELLQLRADFDEATARQWLKYRKENKGATFDEFLFESDAFRSLRDNYDKALDARREANMKLLESPIKPATKPASTAPSSAPSATPARPNERVIGGTVWERKPDGSWNNTGRKP